MFLASWREMLDDARRKKDIKMVLRPTRASKFILSLAVIAINSALASYFLWTKTPGKIVKLFSVCFPRGLSDA